jgi:hypothetical protein
VANTQSIQFFLKSEKTEEDILDFLGNTIGFLVESTDVEISDSVGFAQISSYTQGFEQGVLVTWPRAIELILTPHELIEIMAARLSVSVLLEPAADGDVWLLAKPDGSVKNANVSYLDDGIDVVQV